MASMGKEQGVIKSNISRSRKEVNRYRLKSLKMRNSSPTEKYHINVAKYLQVLFAFPSGKQESRWGVGCSKRLIVFTLDLIGLLKLADYAHTHI